MGNVHLISWSARRFKFQLLEFLLRQNYKIRQHKNYTQAKCLIVENHLNNPVSPSENNMFTVVLFDSVSLRGKG